MDHPHESNSPIDSGRGDGRRPAIYLENQRHLTRTVAISVNLFIFLTILPQHIRSALFHGLRIHCYLTALLLGFGLIALSLLWSTGQRLDALIFLYFNLRGKRPPWLDRVMLSFTQLGNGLLGFLIALVLFWTDDHHLAYELILGTLTLWLVVEAVKVLIHRSRPYIKLFQARVIGSRPRGRSFPSGHTSQSFFTATLLVQHFHSGFGIAFILYIVAVSVAITRMYVGAHYPRDVMAGAILGSVWGALGAMADAHFWGSFR